MDRHIDHEFQLKFARLVNERDLEQLDVDVDDHYEEAIHQVDRPKTLSGRLKAASLVLGAGSIAGFVYAVEWVPSTQPGAKFSAAMGAIICGFSSVGFFAGAGSVESEKPDIPPLPPEM